MATASIDSREALQEWLKDKPDDWAQIVSARISLRSIPYMAEAKDPFLDETDKEWLRRYAMSLFRAIAISWAARNFPAFRMVEAAAAAAPSTTAASAADMATHSAAHTAANDAGNAAYYAAETQPATIGPFSAPPIFWLSITADCQWLEKQGEKGEDGIASRWLTRRPLWPTLQPLGLGVLWRNLCQSLFSIDPNYSVWIDWYERRIRGERAAFDIPGDKRRIEDKKVLRRLAEATDEDFWGKGHEYVNATLKGWLDEARARVAPSPIIAEASGIFEITGSATAELGPLPTPPQEPGAIAYGVNEQGKLDRLPNSDQAHLRDVPDQRRAYDDLREAAAELLDEGQRLGHRLKRALDRFLHSLPDGFEDAEAYLVWRDANALRRLHRAHREAAKSPEPDEARLEPVVAEGLGGLLDLYNNFAFADDGLRAKDEARIAPQERASAEAEAKAAIPLVEAILANPEIATPEALDDILADAENAELPADDPYAAQVLLQSNESRKNFLAAALAWGAKTLASPKQVGKAVAIGSVTGAAGVVGKVAMTAIIGTDYGPLLPFIAANAEILQRYVAIAFPSFEHLPNLINQLKLLWAKLRH